MSFRAEAYDFISENCEKIGNAYNRFAKKMIENGVCKIMAKKRKNPHPFNL